jgi:hypothetical protein
MNFILFLKIIKDNYYQIGSAALMCLIRKEWWNENSRIKSAVKEEYTRQYHPDPGYLKE